MSRDFDNDNPYASPTYSGQPGGERPKGTVAAPAIALIVLGSLGMIFSVIGVLNALISEPPEVPPDTPEFLREFQKGTVGPLAAVLQVVFFGVNALIVGGAIQMLRFQSWGLALTASILSIVNLGSCCCLLGIPIGIWSIVVLLQPHVKAAFVQSPQ